MPESKHFGSDYLKERVFPQIKDRQWAAVLDLVGFTRTGDPVWDRETNQLECVVQSLKTGLDVSLVIRGSYAHADDGEFYVLVEPLKSGQDSTGSGSHHALYKGQPKDDALSLMKSVAKVLRSLGN